MAPRRPLAAWIAGGACVAGAAALVSVLADTALPPLPANASPPVDAARAAFARSLAGTTADGAASAASGDTLALDPALVRLFDYYLSTLGERPLADIRAQLAGELDRRLPPAAAVRATDLMRRYLDFREALRTSVPPRPAAGRPVDLLRARLHAMQAIRARYFDAVEIAALFGPDDREADVALARMAVEQDPALDPAERRRRLAELDAAAPADNREAREASMAIIRLDAAAAALREQGAGEDAVWHLRAETVSPEAANRLAELDREEAAWKARIADYLVQRRAVLSSSGTDAARRDALAALRDRLFTPAEQRRLPAYEG